MFVKRTILNWTFVAFGLIVGTSVILSGCNNSPKTDPSTGPASATKTPSVFSIATSEYPSWSVFVVAADLGLIDGAAGKQGELEKKHGVDIELKVLDYDSCLLQYGNAQVDSVCITNVDVLKYALTIPSTATLVTSTSYGADACISAGVNSIEELKGQKVYGLQQSVSEYVFCRALEKKGLNPRDFTFAARDPGAAAQNFQLADPEVKAIMVWNPFVLETLRKRNDAKRLFDSTDVANEVFDMVVTSNTALKREGGESFVRCVNDAYYAINERMKDSKTADATYVALGARFSSLGLEDMKLCCKETKFFGTPEQGVAVFKGADLPKAMKEVVRFCREHDMITAEPTIGYDNETAQLNFSTKYMTK